MSEGGREGEGAEKGRGLSGLGSVGPRSLFIVITLLSSVHL